jgi:Dolichyl-phosphate-mannose-protein mannosyltransferase
VSLLRNPVSILKQPIFWLLLVFVMLASTYAVTTPLFEASDELWHYPMVQHLSQGGALPVQDPNNVGPWRQEASQPPLYYYLTGWATAWINTNDLPQVRWLNPHVDNGVITPDGNINLAIHTPAENWPWQGTVLAVRLIRLMSVLMSAGTVLFTYLLAREYFEDEASRLAAAGLVAFVPMFVFISGAVNNDNMSALLSSTIFFLLVFLVRRPLRFNWKFSVGLGLLLGIAALTKQSALGLYPLTGLTLVVLSLQRIGFHFSQTAFRAHFIFILKHSLLAFVPGLLIPAWWYYRNIVLYGDLLGWNGFIDILGKRAAPASLLQLWGERESFTRSYWGLFGGVNVPMSDWIYTVLNLMALIAFLGLTFFAIRAVIKFLRERPTDSKGANLLYRLIDSLGQWVPYALLLGMLILLAYGLYQWATVTWSMQGRLVFSGISAIAVLMVIGLRTLLPGAVRAWGLGAIMIFMAVVSAAAPFAFIGPKYVDPPSLTPAQLAGIEHPLNVDFGSVNFPPEMRLLGYKLDLSEVKPGGSVPLTLYWQSLVAMDRDWSVFVHVLDENGVIIAHRDVFPGVGLMPTRKWQVGETLADTYLIPIPETAYAPSAARIEVGLYDYETGDRLLVVTEGNADSGRDALALTPLTLAANPGDVPNPQTLNFGGQIGLAGYEMDKRAVKAGESINLTLYWRDLQTMKVNYSVFAHVRGKGETLWAGHDSWPLEGDAPTSTWTVGQLIKETRTLTLKPETPPGDYDVEVGLYDEGGKRLQLLLPDGRLTDNFVYLAKIKVLP